MKDYFRTNRSDVKILIPGVALGRLAWEASKLGFNVMGCERHSMKAILFGFIMKGGLTKSGQYPIYPHLSKSGWIHSRYRSQAFWIPDEDPKQFQRIGSNLNLFAGMLQQVPDSHKWDCILSNFFIDTAPNIFEYLDHFHRLLKPGGLVINNGPLKFESEGQCLIDIHCIQVF